MLDWGVAGFAAWTVACHLTVLVGGSVTRVLILAGLGGCALVACGRRPTA